MERTALQAKKAAMPAIAKLRPIMGLRTVSLLELTQERGAVSASNCASKKYTPVQLRWMRRYSGLLMTPQAMRGGAAVDVPPATA